MITQRETEGRDKSGAWGGHTHPGICKVTRTPLAIQRLRVGASTSGGRGLAPGQRTKISHAEWPKQQQNKTKQNKYIIVSSKEYSEEK